MIFCNSKSLGNDFFFLIFTLNLKNIKLYIDILDIVLPCGYITISIIQICKKKKKKRTKCYHTTTIELKDSQLSMLCTKSQDIT